MIVEPACLGYVGELLVWHVQSNYAVLPGGSDFEERIGVFAERVEGLLW